jgi:periplasmic divalent cation tolerance protein
MLVVLTTTSTFEEADALAGKIVESRLAACVQILPQMTSVYVWEGKTQRESECLLLIKTVPEKWDELSEFISANHSYEVPEIVALNAKAAQPYLAWLNSELTSQII